jgi:hypothetical protein
LVEPAQGLAVLRIVVAGIILLSPELRRGAALAADSYQTDVLPEGLHALAGLPISVEGARLLQWLAISSAVTGLLGYFSRISMLLLTVSGGLVFSFSQRSGAVIHDMHLFWFTSLLSVSRCGDVWALDAWGKLRPAPSLRYGVPAAGARLLLGCVYFFPAVHKLIGLGPQFISAEHQIHEMHAKWFQFARLPLLRIDHYPLLCSLGAVLVLCFELSFLLLVQLRRTRLIAAAFGLLFHLGTSVFFFIHFPSLWACYAMLLPFRGGAVHERASHEAWPLAASVVGCALLIPVVIQGIRGKTQAWPFACYPTFDVPVGDTLVDLSFEIAHPNGRLLRFTGREREPRSQFEWRRVFYLANDPRSLDGNAQLEFAAKMAKRAGVTLPAGGVLRVFRVEYSTEPEAWGRPAVKSEQLLEQTITR